MQMLIVQTLDGEHRVFELYGEDIVIGRERGRDLQLAHASVSREHAHLSWRSGGYSIRDAGSHNGTYINGERVSGERGLTSGDMIRLGHFELIYIEGAVPKRFQRLNIHNIPRWYAVGTDVMDDATSQVSMTVMKRLLQARVHLEGGVLVLDDDRGIDLEDQRWVLGGPEADIPVKMLFGSSPCATVTWNGRNHVLTRIGQRAVKVNGQSVRTCTLEDGDRIAIGRSRFGYEVRQ